MPAESRLRALLVLAALVAAAATFFGREFAPEEQHHEEPAAEVDHHAEGGDTDDEHAEPQDETSAGQVTGAVLISIAAVVLMPVTAPVVRRRRREDEVAGSEPRLADFLAVDLALLSLGAGVIHFAVLAQHLDGWWLSGVFFAVVALFQLGWAVALLARRVTPLLLAGGAAVNGLVVLTWIVSRSVGVPVGPEAGEAESIGLADVVATSYEVLLVAVASVFASKVSAARELPRPRGVATATWIAAGAIAAMTALALALLP